MTLVLGTLVIALAIVAILRRLDVRLVLFVAALLLGILAGNLDAILIEFFATFANERYVVPICMAMGFAHVLRLTGCDQHLVHLLVRPLTRVRPLLIPGTVIAGFIVNIPVVSQTSSAATLGPVVIPILQAARYSPVTIAATLVLGCSIGGELLNPGAPELRTVVEESHKAVQQAGGPKEAFSEHECVQRILPLDLMALAGATCLFWWLMSRAGGTGVSPVLGPRTGEPAVPPTSAECDVTRANGGAEEAFRINFVKAAIPFLPLLLLLLTGPPLNLITIPHRWLVSSSSSELTGLYNSRLIGLAMLVGVLVAALAAPRRSLAAPRAFFDGAGYAFANIISLIVTANCFGVGVKEIGVAALIGDLIRVIPVLLIPAAGTLPLGFGLICGSGMAATQSLFGFFAGPAVAQGQDPIMVGAVVSLAAAAGRTMSPVAAVVLMCATMTDTSPFDIVKRVALPLVFGIILVVATAMMISLAG